MPHRRTSPLLAAVVAGAAFACASAPRVGAVATPVRAAPAAVPAPQPAALADAPVALPPGAESGGLSFAVVPSDAEVLIDGRSFGKVAELARSGTVPLQPGLYQVSLRRAGYATWRAEVAVGAAIEPIRVRLTERPAKP